MKLELKQVEGHRRVVITAPGAERLKQTSLLRAINTARQWMDMLINGEAKNVTDLAKRLGKKNGYIGRILSLNSLAQGSGGNGGRTPAPCRYRYPGRLFGIAFTGLLKSPVTGIPSTEFTRTLKVSVPR